MKRTLAALAALLAAGLTLALPAAWTERGAARSVAAVSTAANVPETHHPEAAHGQDGAAAPRWKRSLDKLTSGVPISVSAEEYGQPLFTSRPAVERVPASNEKLLLSMAILDALGTDHRIETTASVARFSHGVVCGDLWLEGAGDPTIASADLGRLARRIKADGVRRITGSVLGSVEPFGHDWNAPGWKPRFRREEVGLPTALTFDRNTIQGKHVSHPERYAAASFAKHLRKLHVKIGHPPGAGRPPENLDEVASISSPPLLQTLHDQDVDSINFFAEVLNKLLGYTSSGTGTIAAGAAEIQTWAAANGVDLEAHDGSGLSYANRVSAEGIVDLLEAAENQAWGPKLRSALPHAGQGTLRGRLAGIKLHAKTGTLHVASALCGWVWIRHDRTWAPFSILAGDIATDHVIALEDQIVRIIARNARLGAASRTPQDRAQG
ncbi:MAG: D-alanyl-D-alanine carboxypeptidase/D-alanyl-D-alanine-endopeptidase [Actinomycetota bacterium]